MKKTHLDTEYCACNDVHVKYCADTDITDNYKLSGDLSKTNIDYSVCLDQCDDCVVLCGETEHEYCEDITNNTGETNLGAGFNLTVEIADIPDYGDDAIENKVNKVI